MHKVIVVGVDGSSAGYAALREAAELARRFGAKLIALSVEEGLPRYPALMGEVEDFQSKNDRYFEEVTEEARGIARACGVRLRHQIHVGRAADVIVRVVEDVGADLVVLGGKRHSRIAQALTRSTAQRVSAASSASVLIVKSSEGPEAIWDRILNLP